MYTYNEDEFRELLKRAVPPVEGPELGRDLWPAMIQRLDGPGMRATPLWWEWALLGLIPISIALFPRTALALLIQI